MGLLADYIMHRVRMRDQERMMGERRDQLASLFGGGGGGLLPGAESGGGGGGLMGGGFGMEQALGLMSIPGLEGIGGSLLGSVVQRGWDLRDQARQRAQALSPAQKWAQERQKAFFDAETEKLLREQYPNQAGDYTPQQRASVEETMRKGFWGQAEGSINALERYNNATQRAVDRGGFDKFTGADDIALVKEFAKMVLANEAVMDNDQKAAELARGFGGTVDQWLGWLTGKGQLGEAGRQQIYGTMTGLAQQAKGTLQRTQQRWLPRVQERGLSPTQVLTDVPMAEPWAAQPAIPPAEQAEIERRLQSRGGGQPGRVGTTKVR